MSIAWKPQFDFKKPVQVKPESDNFAKQIGVVVGIYHCYSSLSKFSYKVNFGNFTAVITEDELQFPKVYDDCGSKLDIKI